MRPSTERWKELQAEGKRNYVRRRLKWGAGVGAFTGVVLATILTVVGTKRMPLVIAIPTAIVASVSVMSLALLLWYLLVWELLRRQYSRS